MDISLVGNVFVYGHEKIVGGNDANLTAEFKVPLDPAKIFASYKKMVVENPGLQSKWIVDDGKKQFAWKQFTKSELDERLNLEKEHLMKSHTFEEILNDYVPTNARLPFRISIIDDRTLVFSWNHLFNNSALIASWLETWLRCYAKETNLDIDNSAPLPVYNGFTRCQRIMHRFLASFRAIAYMVSLKARYRKNAVPNTVDPTHGRKPAPPQLGYTTKKYYFTREETEGVIYSSKQKELDESGFVLTVLAKSFFDKFPDKNRILVNCPADIRHYIPGVDYYSVGNYSGSLILQALRDKPIEKQVRKGYRWINRDVPFGVMKMLHFFFKKDHIKLKNKIEERTTKPIPERGPLGNFTFVYGLGEISPSQAMEQMISRLFITGKHHNVVICGMILNGKLNLEIVISKDLCSPEEVFAVTDLAVQHLKKLSHIR